MVRTALYEAANVLLTRIMRFSKLKRWAICGGLTVDHGRKRELGDATITRGDLTSPGPFTHKIVRSVTAIDVRFAADYRLKSDIAPCPDAPKLGSIILRFLTPLAWHTIMRRPSFACSVENYDASET